MTELPKISIIIPSFNQGQYIEQTILSVINQQYDNYELIVIDGGSTDDTVEIIKKYKTRIAYWVSEKDNGQADAINKGLTKVTGDVFNWINSDDYLETGALRTIGKYFLDNPGMHVLCGYTRCFFDVSNNTSHIYRMGIKKTVTNTILNVEMNQPGTFYRTTVIKAIGGVNASLRYVFDNELWFRFLGNFGIDGIGITDKLLAQFRLHKDSKTVYEGYDKFNEESNDIWLFLAKRFCFNRVLVQLMAEDIQHSKYMSSDWNYAFIDKVKMERYFSDKYMLGLALHGEYAQAKLGWKHRYKREFPRISRLLFSAFFKLFILPKQKIKALK